MTQSSDKRISIGRVLAARHRRRVRCHSRNSNLTDTPFFETASAEKRVKCKEEMLDRKKWSGGRARKSNQPPRELNGRATDNLSGVFGRCMEHQDVLVGLAHILKQAVQLREFGPVPQQRVKLAFWLDAYA